MAIQEKREVYSHVTIDCSDMVLTEYCADDTRTYSITEILKRWNGIGNVEIEIRQKSELPVDER